MIHSARHGQLLCACGSTILTWRSCLEWCQSPSTHRHYRALILRCLCRDRCPALLPGVSLAFQSGLHLCKSIGPRRHLAQLFLAFIPARNRHIRRHRNWYRKQGNFQRNQHAIDAEDGQNRQAKLGSDRGATDQAENSSRSTPPDPSSSISAMARSSSRSVRSLPSCLDSSAISPRSSVPEPSVSMCANSSAKPFGSWRGRTGSMMRIAQPAWPPASCSSRRAWSRVTYQQQQACMSVRSYQQNAHGRPAAEPARFGLPVITHSLVAKL